MDHKKRFAALAACLIVLAPWLCAPPAQGQAASQGPVITGNPAPSPEQIRTLITRAIENQHRDDIALQEYERIEHKVAHASGNSEGAIDITERVLPHTTGTFKLKTAEKGVPVSEETYRTELQAALTTFGLILNPGIHYKEDVAKFEKRRHDHAELVDEAEKAFRVTWAGWETRSNSTGTHTYMKFLLDPNPKYEPINRLSAVFQHMHATIWVDEQQAQFARAEADVATDIPFFGGVAGKVYHGGHVVMEQEEAAPGIWLPTLYSYDVDGRKFVFAFGIHERTDITRYRYIGPPAQAIAIVRNDLNNLKTVTSAR